MFTFLIISLEAISENKVSGSQSLSVFSVLRLLVYKVNLFTENLVRSTFLCILTSIECYLFKLMLTSLTNNTNKPRFFPHIFEPFVFHLLWIICLYLLPILLNLDHSVFIMNLFKSIGLMLRGRETSWTRESCLTPWVHHCFNLKTGTHKPVFTNLWNIPS